MPESADDNLQPMDSAANRSKAVRGFVCPRHGCRLHVRQTRPAARNIRVRYLACPKAGCKFVEVTEERPRK